PGVHRVRLAGGRGRRAGVPRIVAARGSVREARRGAAVGQRARDRDRGDRSVGGRARAGARPADPTARRSAHGRLRRRAARGRRRVLTGALLSEGALGPLRPRNRLIRAGTSETMAAVDGAVTDQLIRLYETLAANEVGAIFTGHLYCHQRGQYARR